MSEPIINLDSLSEGLKAAKEENNEEINRIAELSQQGYQLLKENLLTEAETCFKQILTYDENNNYALVGLGDAARKRSNYRQAIDYYEKCLIQHADNNYALFGLADCYKALRQYNLAIKIWEKYLVHDDKNITVLTRVADAYRKVKNLEKSSEIYNKVLEIEPDNAYALIGLGHLFYDFKQYELAMKFWGRMLEVHGDSVDIRVLTSLGNCHRKLKTYNEGLIFFQKALELEPDNFYALFGLADCYRGSDRHPESLVYWMRILDLDPNNKVILTRAGDAYRNMGDFENAEEFYTKALNIEFDAYAILGLALINKQKGKFQEAIESLEGLLKNDPKNHRLYIEIADCYLSLDERNNAVEILERFLSTGMKNSYILEMHDKIKQLG
jgi:tetratricopeptide (TPR) repeat protein